MASEFDILVAEFAAPALVEQFGTDEAEAITIIPTTGDEIGPIDAILGNMRVEDEDVGNADFEEVMKVERRDAQVALSIDVPKTAGVMIGDDANHWSIESIEGGALVVLHLSRPWLAKKHRTGYER